MNIAGQEHDLANIIREDEIEDLRSLRNEP
jgi:hypothetical protein